MCGRLGFILQLATMRPIGQEVLHVESIELHNLIAALNVSQSFHRTSIRFSVHNDCATTVIQIV